MKYRLQEESYQDLDVCKQVDNRDEPYDLDLLHAIVVCKEFQNQHIGRRCVGDMIKLAKEKGIDTVKANIYSFNEQSRRMFEAVGFKKIDEEWYEYQSS